LHFPLMFPYGEEGYSIGLPNYNTRADQFENERNAQLDEN
jgi:hypothetical protein